MHPRKSIEDFFRKPYLDSYLNSPLISAWDDLGYPSDGKVAQGKLKTTIDGLHQDISDLKNEITVIPWGDPCSSMRQQVGSGAYAV